MKAMIKAVGRELEKKRILAGEHEPFNAALVMLYESPLGRLVEQLKEVHEAAVALFPEHEQTLTGMLATTASMENMAEIYIGLVDPFAFVEACEHKQAHSACKPFDLGFNSIEEAEAFIRTIVDTTNLPGDDGDGLIERLLSAHQKAIEAHESLVRETTEAMVEELDKGLGFCPLNDEFAKATGVRFTRGSTASLRDVMYDHGMAISYGPKELIGAGIKLTGTGLMLGYGGDGSRFWLFIGHHPAGGVAANSGDEFEKWCWLVGPNGYGEAHYNSQEEFEAKLGELLANHILK